jgi:hypothetical protein
LTAFTRRAATSTVPARASPPSPTRHPSARFP